MVELWLANSTRCLLNGHLSLVDDIRGHRAAAAADPVEEIL
jgi:hypothetical protein